MVSKMSIHPTLTRTIDVIEQEKEADKDLGMEEQYFAVQDDIANGIRQAKFNIKDLIRERMQEEKKPPLNIAKEFDEEYD